VLARVDLDAHAVVNHSDTPAHLEQNELAVPLDHVAQAAAEVEQLFRPLVRPGKLVRVNKAEQPHAPCEVLRHSGHCHA
jgi:hypothetical protein